MQALASCSLMLVTIASNSNTQLLNFLTRGEPTTFATQTQVFRWSLVSHCAAESKLTEESKLKDNRLCSFAPCSRERDASRAADESTKRPHQPNNNCHNGMGIRLVLPHADTEAVHEHASADHCSLLLACLANAASEPTRTEEDTKSKANTKMIAAPATAKFTTERGPGSALSVLFLTTRSSHP